MKGQGHLLGPRCLRTHLRRPSGTTGRFGIMDWTLCCQASTCLFLRTRFCEPEGPVRTKIRNFSLLQFIFLAGHEWPLGRMVRHSLDTLMVTLFWYLVTESLSSGAKAIKPICARCHCCSAAKLCLVFRTHGLQHTSLPPVFCYFLEFGQINVHYVGDAI